MLLLAAGLWPGAALAQRRQGAPEGAFVNVVYALQFGLGSYEIGGLDVDVFQVPYTHPIDLTPGDDPWQVNVTGALTYGHASLDIVVPELGRVQASADFLVGSAGAELVIPIRRWWKLKPYGEVGLGTTFSGDVVLYTYTAGLTNLFELQLGDSRVSFGHAVAWAGNDAFQSGTQQEAYATINTGVEVRHPLGFTIRGVAPDVGVFLVHYHFLPAATFSRPGRAPLEVTDQLEIGATVGTAGPFKLLGLIDNPRLGVSYRFGDGLYGVRVSFGFPF